MEITRLADKKRRVFHDDEPGAGEYRLVASEFYVHDVVVYYE